MYTRKRLSTSDSPSKAPEATLLAIRVSTPHAVWRVQSYAAGTGRIVKTI
jgi:hypothetical protein